MKMTTPIRDFVVSYAEKSPLRLHMPGHKGVSLLGFEAFDITEVTGADSLYEASGIIGESEANASLLFHLPDDRLIDVKRRHDVQTIVDKPFITEHRATQTACADDNRLRQVVVAQKFFNIND